MLTKHRVIIAGLIILLVAALIATTFLFLLALRPLVRAGDGPLVERARRDARAAFGGVETGGRSTFPIVMRLLDRSCVELRSTRSAEAGNYHACYDNRTGRKIEERATVGFESSHLLPAGLVPAGRSARKPKVAALARARQIAGMPTGQEAPTFHRHPLFRSPT